MFYLRCSFISTLSDIVKNEKSETQLRILSVIALYELHSDKGEQLVFPLIKD